MAELINSGRAYIAAHTVTNDVDITQFVLALVPGLDYTDPVDMNETMPDAGEIKWQGSVTTKGYVSADKVVYSLLIGPAVGPFQFNWIGLLASDNTLVAVAYVPTVQKYATDGDLLGNTITRNFLLAFTDAKATTNIVVQAGTWQIDFETRFAAIEADIVDLEQRMADAEQAIDDVSAYAVAQTAITRLHAAVTRQTVLSGPTTAGQADFLEGDGAFTVLLVAGVASSPLRVSFADGFDNYGERNLLVSISAPESISGWTLSYGLNYCYLQASSFALDAAITTGVSTLAPIYADTAPGSPASGQYWFNTTEWRGYVYNGSVWQSVLRVYVGAAFTIGVAVEGVVSYAYCGVCLVDMGSLDYSGSILETESHNLGVGAENVKTEAIIEISSSMSGLVAGDVVSLTTLLSYGASALGAVITLFTRGRNTVGLAKHIANEIWVTGNGSSSSALGTHQTFIRCSRSF